MEDDAFVRDSLTGERLNPYIIVTMKHMSLQFEFATLDEAAYAANGLVQAEGVIRVDVYNREAGSKWDFFTPRPHMG